MSGFAAIYTITCIPSARVYVGQARNLHRRWQSHRWNLRRGTHRNAFLQRAWTKHGEQNFEFAIVRRFSDVPELPAELAVAELEELRRHKRIFNLIRAGQQSLIASDATRQKLRDQRIKMWADPAYKDRLRLTHLARPRDPTIGERISSGKSTLSAREAAGEQSSARWADPVFRERRSLERKQDWQDPDYRERQTASRRRAWATGHEMRVNALRAAYADPERRKAREAKVRATMALRPTISKSAIALLGERDGPVTADEILTRATRDGARVGGLKSVLAILAKMVREGQLVRTPKGWTLS